VKKTYEVEANRLLSDAELQQMSNGIKLEDGPVNPAKVRRNPMNPVVTEISVFEGRNHLIRRMIAYFGAEVTRLKRIRYAGLSDKDMRIGRWRYLKQKEINDLRKLVKLDTLDFNKDQ
jgi:23S rRNA pseudouridine2605 synthase